MSQTRLVNVNRDNYEALAKQGQLKNNFLVGAFDSQKTSEPGYRLFFLGDAEQGNEGIRSIVNGFSRAPHTDPIKGYELLNPSWLKQFLEKGADSPALQQALNELMTTKEKKDFEASSELNKKRLFLIAYLKKALGETSYKDFIGGFNYSPANIFSLMIQGGLTEEAITKWVPRFNNQGTESEGVTATYMFAPLSNGAARVLCFVRVKDLTFLNTQNNEAVEAADYHAGETYAQFMLQQNEGGKWGWQLLNFQTKDPLMAKIIQGEELVTLSELEKHLGKTPLKQESSQPISALPTSAPPVNADTLAIRNTLAGVPSQKTSSSPQTKKNAETEKRPDASWVNLANELTPSQLAVPKAGITTSFIGAPASLPKSELSIEPLASAPRPVVNEDLVIIKLIALIDKYKEHIETKLQSTTFQKSQWDAIAAQAYNHKNPPDMPRAKRLAFKKYHALQLLENVLTDARLENDPKEMLIAFKAKLSETRGVLDQKRNWYDLTSSEGSKLTDEITILLNEQKIKQRNN